MPLKRCQCVSFDEFFSRIWFYIIFLGIFTNLIQKKVVFHDLLGHYVKWQGKKKPGKKNNSNKTAIDKKLDRWSKALDTMIVKDHRESNEGKPRRPGSGGLKQKVDKIKKLNPKLMVPIVYPATMNVQPCNEVADLHNKNSRKASLFAAMTQGVKKKLERTEEDEKTLTAYHRPPQNVRARLKSEHLSFLQRQELETTAQEFYELNAILKQMAIKEEEEQKKSQGK